MWWKTTEIHRASLPSSEIKALDEIPITFTINLGVYIADNERRQKFVDDLEGLFKSNDIFNARVTGININESVIANIRTPAKLESILMNHYQVKPGDLLIAEWAHLEDDILVTNDRTIFISRMACKLLKFLSVSPFNIYLLYFYSSF